MFEIGFTELLLVAIVALLVLGPERLPEALRTMGLWLGRMRRSFNAVKTEIEKEIGMDEIRRQLHNEAVMDELKRIEREVRSTGMAVSGSKPATPPAGVAPGQPRTETTPSVDADHAPLTAIPNAAAAVPATASQPTAGDTSEAPLQQGQQGQQVRQGAGQDG